jgi:excisionase family DNA binding protein
MTGRDLILYILENRLEDKRIFENGTFLGFITPNEAATKMGVGVATVFTWIFRGQLDYVKIGSLYLIPADCELSLGDCDE